MKSARFIPRHGRGSLKKIFLRGAAAALAAMGVVTMETGSTGASDTSTFVATGTPTTTPTVPSAGPVVKATNFNGGGWPGMGSFGEDWAK
jgi:hypothetical protein